MPRKPAIPNSLFVYCTVIFSKINDSLDLIPADGSDLTEEATTREGLPNVDQHLLGARAPIHADNVQQVIGQERGVGVHTVAPSKTSP
jgi:hypothetical protein